MPTIHLMPDSLNEENPKFAQVPLKQALFLNSLPKSGSHLLRNIIRMFVPVDQQYAAQFIQYGNLAEHVEAFESEKHYLSWGHLLFSDASAIEVSPCRKVILVRDPYDWVLARARFFLSDEFEGNAEQLKGGMLSMEAMLNLMIFGIYQKAPSLAEMYQFHAAAWLGTGAMLVRYEDLAANLKALDSDEAEAFFGNLLTHCGIDMPADWRARVIIGSDRKQSGTARENLSGGGLQIPDILPDEQKRLVDYVAPGLRGLLGYS